MAEELIYNVGVEGIQSLDSLEQKVTKAGQATNKTTNYFQQMKRELREARGDMLKFAEGTEQYNRALNKASDIQGRMNDSNDKVKAGIRDLGETTKSVAGTVAGFAGGFQVAQASMQLFGIENENAVQAILKLQQVMSVVQGLSTFSNAIDSMQDLVASIKASKQATEVLAGPIGELGNVSDDAAKSVNTLGKESAVLSSNLAGTATIGEKVTKGNEKMLNSIKEYSDSVILGKETVNEFTKELVKTDIALLKNGEGIEDISNKNRELVKSVAGSNATTKEAIKVLEEELSLTEEAIKNKGDLTKATNTGTKAAGGFTKSILMSLGTMVAFLAIIALVSIGISKLIEYLHKVPESIKVKLEIDEQVQKDLDKERLNIEKFASDYRKA